MLRRQRTFFLTQNQYESVILEYVGIVSGRQAYRFNKEEPDVNGYTIWARISNDGGLHWGNWYSNAVTINFNPASFTFPFEQGSMCEVYVIVTGDGTKDPSDPSNIITAITPVEPSYSPPVLSAFPFYYDGEVCPAVLVEDFPSGVSSYIVWIREFGHFSWEVCCWVNDGRVGLITESPYVQIQTGKTYQFISAWWNRTTGKLISDISNVATVALPSSSINYLLPPKKLAAYFYGDYQGTYYNVLGISRGDMRATSVLIEYKRSSVGGDWTQAFEYVFSEHGIDENTRSYNITPSFGSATPITGEVWQYRLRNKANGYALSGYSDIFVITIPSFLPKLDTPTITLAQNGASVLVGWNSVSNASGYKIERRLNNVTSFTEIASVPSSYSRYEDYGTSLGYTYVYRVTALGDNQYYQDSSPAQGSITLENIVVLEAPVIDSVTESGIDVVLVVSNINAPNTMNVPIEMSENGGAWKSIGAGYPETMAQTSFTFTVPGEMILEGGTLRFRARAMPEAMARDPSPYSEIASITIAEREWLLRWNGSSWDDPSGTTGGWYSPDITFSDGVVSGNVQQVDLGSGTMRFQGTGFLMTRNALTSGRTGLSAKYSRICMIGSLVKQVDGSTNYAMFGSGHTYPFSGGTCIELRSSYYTFAGSNSGRAPAGTKTNPYATACTQGTYATSTGSHIFFRFYNGFADVKGIYAIKR